MGILNFDFSIVNLITLEINKNQYVVETMKFVYHFAKNTALNLCHLMIFSWLVVICDPKRDDIDSDHVPIDVLLQRSK